MKIKAVSAFKRKFVFIQTLVLAIFAFTLSVSCTDAKGQNESEDDTLTTVKEDENVVVLVPDASKRELCQEEMPIGDVPPPPGGSLPPIYDTVLTHALIDSIKGNEVYLSLFRKSDGKRIVIPYGNTGSSRHWRIRIHQTCVSSNIFSVGDTMSSELWLIACGTATPLILHFLEHQECFLGSASDDYWWQ